MEHAKRGLTLLLHLAATALIQWTLFRLLLGGGSLLDGFVGCLLPSLLACTADFIGTCLLLREHRTGPMAYRLLQFWDVFLICPALVLALLGLFSDGEAVRLGICALLADMLLIVERSASFVLLDPARQN